MNQQLLIVRRSVCYFRFQHQFKLYQVFNFFFFCAENFQEMLFTPLHPLQIDGENVLETLAWTG